jgi:hypothetical protein
VVEEGTRQETRYGKLEASERRDPERFEIASEHGDRNGATTGSEVTGASDCRS